jgi:hypothetical protein
VEEEEEVKVMVMGASNAVKLAIMHETVQILLQALNQEVEVD